MNDGDRVRGCFHPSTQLVVSGYFSSLAIPSLSLVTLHLGGPLAARPLPFCTPNDDAEGKSVRDTTAKLHCSPANNVLFSTLILFFRHLVNGRPSPSIIPPPLFTVFCLSILRTSERHRDYHRTEPKFVNGGGGAILRRLQPPPCGTLRSLLLLLLLRVIDRRRHVHHRHQMTLSHHMFGQQARRHHFLVRSQSYPNRSIGSMQIPTTNNETGNECNLEALLSPSVIYLMKHF